MKKLFIFIRSLIFNILMILVTLVHSVLSLFTFSCSFQKRYQFIVLYSKFIIYLAKVICGIRYHIEGLENLPKEEAAIVLSNHQSTWETLAFQVFLPTQTWVVKKELLKIPFFGWAFALLEPIAIDRKLPASAKDQMLSQGKERLKEGRWVIIFPEGTRVNAGEKKRFSRGGAVLAEQTENPVIPIAHNAGDCWGRKSFLKKPGTIKVIIGPIINSKNKNSHEINDAAKTWIYQRLSEIQK